MKVPPLLPRRIAGPAVWELLLDGAAVIAAVFAVAHIASTRSVLILVVLAIGGAAVILRRRMPVPAAAAAILTSGLVLGEPDAAVPIWVLAEVVLFSLALRARRSIVLIAGVVHAVLLFLGAVLVFRVPLYDPLALILPVWTAAVIAWGSAVRSNHDYVRALEEQTRAALAVRDSEVRRHVGAERLRIARDLHDSVAHTVSIISVHAGAAERFLARDPQRARDSLQQVRASARAVVDELQDILAVLRGPDAADVVDAVPGIESLDDLIAAARAAGTEVRLHLAAPPDLDHAVGVAVYRIVQESVTNARKHGNGAIEISIDADDTAVRVRVANPFAPRAASGGGFGLLGMRERVASVNGTVRAEADGDRFVVEATLPLHPRMRSEVRP
jgi:signal transduction histidine kinase